MTWYEQFAQLSRECGTNRIILDRKSKDPYLERFYLVNRIWTLGILRVFVHRFWKSDDDGGYYHDHPWVFWGTYILKGGYTEHTPKGSFVRKQGDFVIKTGWSSHWVELNKNSDGTEQECWTAFFVGPKIKSWGFKKDAASKTINWKIYLKGKIK